jgi:hypothetical protein
MATFESRRWAQKNNNEAEGKRFFTTVYAIDALHTHNSGSKSRGLELCSAPVLRMQRVF